MHSGLSPGWSILLEKSYSIRVDWNEEKLRFNHSSCIKRKLLKRSVHTKDRKNLEGVPRNTTIARRLENQL